MSSVSAVPEHPAANSTTMSTLPSVASNTTSAMLGTTWTSMMTSQATKMTSQATTITSQATTMTSQATTMTSQATTMTSQATTITSQATTITSQIATLTSDSSIQVTSEMSHISSVSTMHSQETTDTWITTAANTANITSSTDTLTRLPTVNVSFSETSALSDATTVTTLPTELTTIEFTAKEVNATTAVSPSFVETSSLTTTAAASTDADLVSSTTSSVPTYSTGDSTDLIIGLTCMGCIILAAVGIILALLWYRRVWPFKAINSTSPPVDEERAIPMTDLRPRAMKLAEFEECVIERHKNSNMIFSEEFNLIKTLRRMYPTTDAQLAVNKTKNRFTDILPYDRTRVKLSAADCDEGSDYINANYIRGFTSQREYIATQGPMPSTLEDFWRMIWEQHVTVIVMLTRVEENGKKKCECYWPTDEQPVYHGDLQLQLESAQKIDNYTLHLINISLGSKVRLVKHIHYESWPDYGCPKSPEELNNLVLSVRSHLPHKDHGPIVVHCSAGVGRTGAFITVDRVMQQLREHGFIDIFGTVMDLRECRCNMVQMEDQYAFIHDCIVEDVKNFLKPPPSEEPLYGNTFVVDELQYANTVLNEPLYRDSIVADEPLYANAVNDEPLDDDMAGDNPLYENVTVTGSYPHGHAVLVNGTVVHLTSDSSRDVLI